MKSDQKKLTIEQCKDSGLALVLISLICFQVWKLPILVILAIVFLLGAMTWPLIYKPFARFWFALSTALGTVASRIILSLLFFVLVCPVSFVRKLMGKDSMRIKDWKKGKDPVFRVRDHKFVAVDLEHPY
jgi:polyferredoxin